MCSLSAGESDQQPHHTKLPTLQLRASTCTLAVLNRHGSGARTMEEDRKWRAKKKVGDRYVSGRHLRHEDKEHGMFYCR